MITLQVLKTIIACRVTLTPFMDSRVKSTTFGFLFFIDAETFMHCKCVLYTTPTG